MKKFKSKLIFTSFGLIATTAVMSTSVVSCGTTVKLPANKTLQTIFLKKNLTPIIQEGLAAKLRVSLREMKKAGAVVFTLGITDDSNKDMPMIEISGTVKSNHQTDKFSEIIVYDFTTQQYSVPKIILTRNILPTTWALDGNYSVNNKAKKTQATQNVFKAIWNYITNPNNKINDATKLYDFTMISKNITFKNNNSDIVAKFHGYYGSGSKNAPKPFTTTITYNFNKKTYKLTNFKN